MKEEQKLSKSEKITLWKHWHDVEAKINEEVQWLQGVIHVFSNRDEINHFGCKQCFLRKLALLIVAGQVEATEITKSSLLKSFWLKGGNHRGKQKIRHGGEWHSATMEKIENHFLSMNLKAMKNFTYLLVPDDSRLIEFKVKSLHSPTPDPSDEETHKKFHSGKNLK